MPLKICMLLHEYYPNDIRLDKEASALIKEGFEIHLICLKRKKEPKQEKINGIYVHRIAIAQSFFWRGIWDVLLSINFFQPRFYAALENLYRDHRFHAIHVHDLPLSKTAIRFREKYGDIKVILDFHENYPEALKVWFVWKKNPLIRLKNRIFFSFSRWFEYEKRMSHQADLLLVVVEEMRDRIISLHRVADEKVKVITNSESISFLNQQELPGIYERKEGDFILAYTGGVGPHRGVDTCIKGLALLSKYPGIRLEITGKLSSASKSWLKNLCEQNDVSEKVKINGYQPFEKFFSYMKFADVNLIPHNRNGHTDNTIPHKLYQGMLTGKPVLVSSAPPLERIVNKLESGLAFEAENAKDFASKVEQLYLNPDLSSRLGKNGKKATLQGNYNWETTSKELVNCYNDLLTD